MDLRKRIAHQMYMAMIAVYAPKARLIAKMSAWCCLGSTDVALTERASEACFRKTVQEKGTSGPRYEYKSTSWGLYLFTFSFHFRFTITRPLINLFTLQPNRHAEFQILCLHQL